MVVTYQFSITVQLQSTSYLDIARKRTPKAHRTITCVVFVFFLLQLQFLPSGLSMFYSRRCSWWSAWYLPSWPASILTSIQRRLKPSLIMRMRKRTRRRWIYIARHLLSHRHRCECQEASGEWTGVQNTPLVAGHSDGEDFGIVNQESFFPSSQQWTYTSGRSLFLLRKVIFKANTHTHIHSFLQWRIHTLPLTPFLPHKWSCFGLTSHFLKEWQSCILFAF